MRDEYDTIPLRWTLALIALLIVGYLGLVREPMFCLEDGRGRCYRVYRTTGKPLAMEGPLRLWSNINDLEVARPDATVERTLAGQRSIKVKKPGRYLVTFEHHDWIYHQIIVIR